MMDSEVEARRGIVTARRWVVKLGSALLTGDGKGLDRAGIATWVEQIAQLKAVGCEVLLVTSGAVAEGVSRLGLAARPTTIHELQAAAAVGQMGLIEAYETAFAQFGLRTALALLTHDDLANRRRYLNARSTLKTLLAYGVVPIINENDTVATEEIRFGDNDTLAAMVTNLIEAEVLVLLTDQQGLFESDPRQNPNAALVTFGRANDQQFTVMAGAGVGTLGRGGMATKLGAARVAAHSGASTVIANGRVGDVLLKIQRGEAVGSLLVPDVEPMVARKRWIAGQLKTKGEIVLDDGAARVVRESGRSLLPVGVTGARGNFLRGDVVLCLDGEGRPVAKGLINYSSEETARILGCATKDIRGRLGYMDEPELMHRDNLVLL